MSATVLVFFSSTCDPVVQMPMLGYEFAHIFIFPYFYWLLLCYFLKMKNKYPVVLVVKGWSFIQCSSFHMEDSFTDTPLKKLYCIRVSLSSFVKHVSDILLFQSYCEVD